MKPTGSKLLKLGHVVALPLIGLSLAVPASAQDASDEAPLEEIVVYSKVTGDVVDVMEVPVAVTAVTGAQIEASGIKDMIDLQQNVPGLIVGGSQTTTTSNFSIRGIGSTANNFGVESSVGLYVDGVYRSRQSSMINDLVDVEAVEVLRGPQGTLFGKNTASGAIQVRTVAPSVDETNAFVEVSLGDLNLQRITGATNIALTDNLAFRGTMFSSQRDGYVDNHVYGPGGLTIQEDLFNDRDRFGFRAQLAWDNGDDLDMRIIADYSEIDEICCIGTQRIDSVYRRNPAFTGAITPFPDLADADFGPDFARLMIGTIVYTDQDYPAALPTSALFAQINAAFGPLGLPPFPVADIPFPNLIEGYSWEDYYTSVNFAPVSQNEDRGLSIEFNKDFDNDMTLTSVTAYRAFDTYDMIDADFTNASIAERTNTADQTSISQELRLAGSFGDGDSNWVVGGYYFSQEINSNTITIAGDQLAAFVDIDNIIQGTPPLSFFTQGVDQISAAIIGMGGFFPPGAEGFPAGAFANDDVTQDHDGYAVFGQVDWALSDVLRLTLGARYTDETKDIDAVYTQTNPGTNRPDLPLIGATLIGFSQWVAGGMQGPPPDPTPLLAIAAPNEGWAAWTLPPFSPRPDVNDTLKDDQVTGTAKLTWYPNDSSMVYASYATGFKSGGTNTDRIEYDWDDPDNPLFSQLFAAETSKSIEVGFKGDLGNNFRLAATYYMTDFEDFQANTFEGSGFILRNAGDLEIEGFELEFLWQPLDNTSISGYYAHNEATYITFPIGVAWDATPFHTGVPDSGDRSGEAMPYNPEDRFMVALTQDFPMGNNNLFFRAEYTYASEARTDGDNDPFTEFDDFGLVNIRLGLDIDSWNSTVTLWGRNITDERYYNGSFDPPLLDRGTMNSYPSEVATYGITFRKNWD